MSPTSEVVQLAQQAVEILKPYLPALATGAATATGKEAPNAVKALWKAIVQRVRGRASGREALEDLAAAPENPAYLTVLNVQVEKALQQDPTFLAELRDLLEAARSETHYQATLHGSGAIAQGPAAKAVGERGVLVEGDVQGSVIVTGDENRLGK
ncbi:MAG: hypothetical protein GXO55_06165 [Chloroflexi bacterium]|nr:hypothetical protein [Chloroflexota bacterium]